MAIYAGAMRGWFLVEHQGRARQRPMTADQRRVLRFVILAPLSVVVLVCGLVAISHSHNYGFWRSFEQVWVVGAAIALMFIAVFGTAS